MIPTIDHWLEWKRICSVQGCTDETHAALSQYLLECATKLAPSEQFYSYDAEVDPAHHIFDSDLVLHSGPEGKPAKDWMIQRSLSFGTTAMGHQQNLNANAKILMRTALRRFLGQEAHEKQISLGTPVISMDTPIPGHERLTLGDLLPDNASPVDAVAESDFADIAAELATEIAPELDPIQRVLLCAYALMLPISNPAVTAAAGRQKSVLSTRAKALVQEMADKVSRKFPEESRAACFYLTRHLMKTLKEHCLATIHDMPGGPEMARAAEAYNPEPEPDTEEA